MSVYLLSHLKDLPSEGETLEIDIHYPNWIVDSQRIGIEQALEQYFSAWLGYVLERGGSFAQEVIGEEDQKDFVNAVDNLLDSAPPGILSSSSPFGDVIRPAFVLSHVSRGGHKTRKKLALLLTAIVSGAASGTASFTFGPGLTYLTSRPQQSIIDGTLVCTKHTAHGLVRSLNHHFKYTEELASRDVPERVRSASNELVRQMASMPSPDCHIRVVASNAEGKETETFELSRSDAIEQVKKYLRKNVHR